MIIFRYLLKEVQLSVLAVTAVVLLVVMSGRFIGYLQEAAEGIISADVLLPIIAYRVPGFLELILPLALLLGILLTYGRLYLDNEMTVMHACGLSPNKLQAYTLAGGVLVAIVVAVLSLWITPWANAQIDEIRQSQNELNEFDTIRAGQFQESRTSNDVTYVAKLNTDRTQLEQVFIYTTVTDQQQKQHTRVISAETAEQYFDPESGYRFVLLKDGYEYVGKPGEQRYRKTKFEGYGFRLDEKTEAFQVSKLASIPTSALLQSEQLSYQAHLHWRLSIPLVCLIVTVLGVALCKVDSRQGRYGKILPSILLYLAFVSLLSSMRSNIESGSVDSVLPLWGIHSAFTLLALSLHFNRQFWSKLVHRIFNLLSMLKPSRKAA